MIINNLFKKYEEKVIFENFSMEIEDGKTTFIMGRSGCGKTTLLNILLGFEKADSGEIIIPNRKIGVVFQENRLCEDFSVFTNIKIVSPNSTKNDIEKHLMEVLMSETIYQPVRELSGGMKRRVAIIRAIITDRDIILMDEPLKGLDYTTKIKTIKYIKKYTKGKTLVIISHDEDEAKLFDGKIIRIGDENYEDNNKKRGS